MHKYLDERLHAAIKTMREFCDTAECDIGYENLAPEDKIARVHHAFTWGIANAGAELESAICEARRMRERSEHAELTTSGAVENTPE